MKKANNIAKRGLLHSSLQLPFAYTLSELDPFDAIENAVLALYPDAEVIYGEPVKARSRPLNGFVIVAGVEPAPHWLVVSQGFSELWNKESDNPDVSGWGFELTCRLPRHDDSMAFGWVLDWMQHVADYLDDSQSYIEAGHSLLAIEPSHPEEQCAIVFADDLAMKSTTASNGGFGFLEMVGLNEAEFQAIQRWSGCAFVDLVRARNPLPLFDRERRSYLDDPIFLNAVEEGIERDGSSAMGQIGVDVMWLEHSKDLHIHLSHDALEPLLRGINNNLFQAAPLLLVGDPNRPNTKLAIGPKTLRLRRWRVENRAGFETALVPLNTKAQSELVSAIKAVPLNQGVRHEFSLPSAKNLRFIVVAPATFADPTYPSR